MMPTNPMRSKDLVVEGEDLEVIEEVGEVGEVAVAVEKRLWLSEFVGW